MYVKPTYSKTLVRINILEQSDVCYTSEQTGLPRNAILSLLSKSDIISNI